MMKYELFERTNFTSFTHITPFSVSICLRATETVCPASSYPGANLTRCNRVSDGWWDLERREGGRRLHERSESSWGEERRAGETKSRRLINSVMEAESFRRRSLCGATSFNPGTAESSARPSLITSPLCVCVFLWAAFTLISRHGCCPFFCSIYILKKEKKEILFPPSRPYSTTEVRVKNRLKW